MLPFDLSDLIPCDCGSGDAGYILLYFLAGFDYFLLVYSDEATFQLVNLSKTVPNEVFIEYATGLGAMLFQSTKVFVDRLSLLKVGVDLAKAWLTWSKHLCQAH